MVKGVFDGTDQRRKRKNHFTVGIVDDVTHTSIDYDPEFSTEDPDTVRAFFSAWVPMARWARTKIPSRSLEKILIFLRRAILFTIRRNPGSMTTSHLRFGPRPIRSSYLVTRANFIACHQFSFLNHLDVLKHAENGATFLLNSRYGPKPSGKIFRLRFSRRLSASSSSST